MVSKISKAAGSAQSNGEKKVVVPREDPVLRAERLLAEAKAKAAEAAVSQVANAKETYERSVANLAKWQRLHDEAKARFALLAERAGVDGPADDSEPAEEPNAGQAYAEAIDLGTSDGSTVDSAVEDE